MPSQAGARGSEPRAARPAAWRWLLALTLATAMAALLAGLARVDTSLGIPTGPDRLLALADATPEVLPEDAELARRILAVRPVDGHAYRLLAQVAAEQGREAESHALYATALRHWPREKASLGALADAAFARGDIAAAIGYVDALLRVNAASRAALLAVLAPTFGDPGVREQLAQRLAADPPWRAALSAALLSPDVPAGSGIRLLKAVARRVPLTEQEVRTQVALLERAGDALGAREAWLQSLPVDDRSAARLVFDGGFEREHVAGGYGWRLQPRPGTRMGHDRAEAAQGMQALRIDFDGRAVAFAGVRQSLVLAPGGYLLGTAARHVVDTSRPFAWRIRCTQGSQAVLAELPLPRLPRWTQAQLAFEVPVDCAAQQLELLHLARSLPERRLRGTLYVDDVRIEPGEPVPMPR